MSETSCSDRFPPALRSSAVPRWSHRDPVEGGNPFPLNDARHDLWQAATCSARDALATIEQELEDAEKMGPHPDPYPVRVVALAVSRFDVWARRTQSIVRSPAALHDFEVWLTMYVANWVAYVADTCPKIDAGQVLQEQLSGRVRHWMNDAGRALEADGSALPSMWKTHET